MSGMSFMSDSWIAWNPRIDEPSNIWPSVKNVASAVSAGTLKCCITPGRSQNRTATNLTPSFLMKAMTSSAELNIRVLLDRRGVGPARRCGVGSDRRGPRFPDRVPGVSVALPPPGVGRTRRYPQGWRRDGRTPGPGWRLLPEARGSPDVSAFLSLIHISEPTRLGMISYAVFCLKKKK